MAWGGVSSLQLGLPLIWTEARKRGIALEKVVGWMSSAPADLVGLPGKGRLAVGADADFSIFAAEESQVVDVSRLNHKNAITPYDGATLTGVVRRTFLAGAEIDGVTPTGKLLRHTAHAASPAV